MRQTLSFPELVFSLLHTNEKSFGIRPPGSDGMQWAKPLQAEMGTVPTQSTPGDGKTHIPMASALMALTDSSLL